MEISETSIAIIGGGIAGLTAAIAFEKLGYQVTVYEASKSIKPVGAGLGLAGNAIGAFRVLDIEKAVIAKGKLLENFPILNQQGRTIYSLYSERVKKRFGVESFTIHRADLHATLISQLKQTTIELNKRLTKIERVNEAYRLTFEDNSDTICHYVIGADGIHSNTRKFIHPHSEVRFSGYVCWRAVTDNYFDIKKGSETWGKNGRVGIVPLADNKIYWYVCLNSKEQKISTLTKDDLAKRFIDYHEPIYPLINSTTEKSLIYNPIIDLKPQNTYTKQGVLLIGDAAHATTPNLGQGACQTIEDVATLYQLMQQAKDLQTAFKLFEKKRLKRTHFIVNTSWKMGKIAQLESPLWIRLRDFLFKHLPERLNHKQLEKVVYNVDYQTN
ncbi:FAD-dependent monooxygenase [Olivibacter ginsenosidimutans]|uniref:FAD-dependent monooxygenase n=1 Tax=Olivibacter ginsenosidimutans TaxID=1176537 RepID=A0ABP9BU19_9SPHI